MKKDAEKDEQMLPQHQNMAETRKKWRSIQYSSSHCLVPREKVNAVYRVLVLIALLVNHGNITMTQC